MNLAADTQHIGEFGQIGQSLVIRLGEKISVRALIGALVGAADACGTNQTR